MWRRASLPAAEDGILPPGENRETARHLTNDQPLVPAERFPPGWKHRRYGRQDARRYGRPDFCFVFAQRPG